MMDRAIIFVVVCLAVGGVGFLLGCLLELIAKQFPHDDE